MSAKHVASKARQLIGLQVQFKHDGWEKWGEVLAYDEETDEYTIRTIAAAYQVSPSELVGVCIQEETNDSDNIMFGYAARKEQGKDIRVLFQNRERG